MTATLPQRKRSKVSHRFRLPPVVGSVSLLILGLFVVSRLFNFFPIAAAIVPFTILVLASLSYCNWRLLQCHRFYWYGAASLLFTGFKYFCLVLLVWSWGEQPFNDYVIWGHAIWLFLGFEGLNLGVFCWFVTQPTPYRGNRIISLLSAILGGCAFAIIAISGLMHGPRRVELRFSGYDADLAQQVEVFYIDYGGSFSARGGIHCQAFVAKPLRVFTRKSSIKRFTARYQKHCAGL